jgi:hypothetical protein
VAIHEIFGRSHTMIVHLDDVGPEVVRKLYEGVTGICNARWFGRIWTAMELVRSGRVRTMTSDGRLVADEEAVEPVFLNKLHAVSADEVRLQHNCVFCVEEAAGMTHDAGGNLVPWNMGPLLEVKRLRRTNFAMAYALLSMRGGRDRMDFLHAFCGIVVGGTEARPLDAGRPRADRPGPARLCRHARRPAVRRGHGFYHVAPRGHGRPGRALRPARETPPGLCCYRCYCCRRHPFDGPEVA